MAETTMVKFLEARFDERQAAAEKCAQVYPPPWDVSDRGWMAKVTADEPTFLVVTTLEQHASIDGWLGDYLQHIAFHDPAQVLADIAAQRAIVEFHKQWPVLVEQPPEIEWQELGSFTVKATQQIAWVTGEEYRKRFGAEPPTTPMMRAMVAVYSNHPDYNPEWAGSDG